MERKNSAERGTEGKERGGTLASHEQLLEREPQLLHHPIRPSFFFSCAGHFLKLCCSS